MIWTFVGRETADKDERRIWVLIGSFLLTKPSGWQDRYFLDTDGTEVSFGRLRHSQHPNLPVWKVKAGLDPFSHECGWFREVGTPYIFGELVYERYIRRKLARA
jgi:hypothetical protein